MHVGSRPLIPVKHWPLHPVPEWVEEVREKARCGLRNMLGKVAHGSGWDPRGKPCPLQCQDEESRVASQASQEAPVESCGPEK